MIATLSAKQLRKAANLQDKIAGLEKKLTVILGGKILGASATTNQPRKKRKMSAAGRAAIVKAQKARWAKIKAQKAGK
jgi:hypothetical protein